MCILHVCAFVFEFTNFRAVFLDRREGCRQQGNGCDSELSVLLGRTLVRPFSFFAQPPQQGFFHIAYGLGFWRPEAHNRRSPSEAEGFTGHRKKSRLEVPFLLHLPPTKAVLQPSVDNRGTMKIPSLVLPVVLVSLLTGAQAQAEFLGDTFNTFMSLSLIDPIIETILEGLRPKLANLTMSDINKKVDSPTFNATVVIKDISLRNLDGYSIQTLKSSLIPLRLNNLTLLWDNINAYAYYDLEGTYATPKVDTPVKLFARGKARFDLYTTLFNIGANLEMKGGTVQVKPKGFFGFDLRIDKADVNFSSLMGSPELGKTVGDFIAKFTPELVMVLKKPFFEAFEDIFINIVNAIFKNYGKLLPGEQYLFPDMNFAEFFE